MRRGRAYEDDVESFQICLCVFGKVMKNGLCGGRGCDLPEINL